MAVLKDKKALRMFAALAQENRLAIFRLLMQEGPDGLSAGTIAEILQVAPATLSFHLGQLENAGLVRSRREGRAIFYTARYKTCKKLFAYLSDNSFKKQQKQVAVERAERNTIDTQTFDDEEDDE